MKKKKVLLSVKDLEVKFKVRGRILTAIRNISLDIYENESIAIVGESGSGKSVFTKTFAGMLDANGFVSNGDIIFNDPSLADTVSPVGKKGREVIEKTISDLNEWTKLEAGAKTFNAMTALKEEKKSRETLAGEELEKFDKEISSLVFKRTEANNFKMTLDFKADKDRIKVLAAEISSYDQQIVKLQKEKADQIKKKKLAAKSDLAYLASYKKKMADLKAKYIKEIDVEVSEAKKKRNEILAKEIYLSTERYGAVKGKRLNFVLEKEIKKEMQKGSILENEEVRNEIFDRVVFRVKYLDETEDAIHGTCLINLAKVKFAEDWGQVRGKKIATIFQDPMTSLNPILTIGNQITSIILKHQKCSEVEARERAITLMKKVGIPNAEKRFDDYPFQYSGGMRQRIVIAIALSCQPKILICDEPTTALDVTIQAQILKLLKDLQKEFNYTIVFITHDLGVVANIADRVAVLYAGQIVELGNVDEIFYDPKHPYTWALLSSMPQLAERNTTLYSITGTPPSLYNKIIGDPFAPRNPYCLKIDTLEDAPMFKVTDTHYAKTWLLDPRAPKVEKPEIIKDIHKKLIKAFNI